MSSGDTEYLYALLKRAARELERLETFGLSRARSPLRPAHVPVLAALLDASPLTPGQLAARCEVEPSTMSGLLNTLERSGLVDRVRLVSDERTSAVSLSARGKAASRVAVKTRTWAQEAVLEKLPDGAGAMLHELLARLVAAAQESAHEAESERAQRSAAARRGARTRKKSSS